MSTLVLDQLMIFSVARLPLIYVTYRQIIFPPMIVFIFCILNKTVCSTFDYAVPLTRDYGINTKSQVSLVVDHRLYKFNQA